MQTEELFKVYNRCKYDIGVSTVNGRSMTIKSGSFQLMTANDILYVESICRANKFFSQKMLVPVDEDGRDIELDQLGMHPDENLPVHMDDKQIEALLKQSAKKIEEYIGGIEDLAELHAIYDVAMTMDLPQSKLKILKAKMPEKDFIEE